MSGILFILVIAVGLIYLVLLFNSKYFWLNKVHEGQSLLYSSSHQNRVKNWYKELLYNIGKFITRIIPESILKQLEIDYFSLDRSEDELYVTFGEAVTSFVFCFSSYIVSHYIFLLLLSFLIPALIILEVNFALTKAKTELENNIEHIVHCLRILIIKSETPIINSLEIIIRDLPLDLIATRKELTKLLEKMKKSGARTTLLEWKTDLPKFRDWISLLISINDGASKTALRLSFDNFLKKIEETQEQELKNKAENIQLYLMGPVLVMLLIISLPMMDAVRFLMTESMQASI